MTETPTQERCLACEVLRDPDDWLGQPSPTAMQVLLLGAEMRASETAATIPLWRIWGPLRLSEFDRPYLERTGHPTLSIRWATALEILNRSHADSLAELQQAIAPWFCGLRIEECEAREARERAEWSAKPGLITKHPEPREIWQSLAERPAMYIGRTSGWLMHCFLTGMDRGGDWLGLPAMPRLREIVTAIEARSVASYGSRWGIWRLNESDPSWVLGRAGVHGAKS